MAKSSKKKSKKVASKSQPAVSFAQALKETKTTSTSPITSRSSSSGTAMATAHMSFTQLLTMFVVFFIDSSVIVYLAHMLFPTQVVLGTHMLSPLTALIYSMGLLCFLLVGSVPVIEVIAEVQKISLKDMHWMAIYFIMNAGFLWIITRFAEMIGLGVASWVVVLALAFVLNLVEGILVNTVVNKVK
jgi:hypothetical protein